MSRRARRPQPRPARPEASVDLVQAVVEAIARGELDQELGVLGAVINERVGRAEGRRPARPAGRPLVTGELRCPPLVLEPLAAE